jgi:phytoene/squalene synthetase
MPGLSADLIETAAAGEPDRVLAAGFALPDARARLITLAGLAHELARTRLAVSEPGLGAIRLHWWREAIAEVFSGGRVRQHPLVQALGQSVDEADLPRALFDTLVDAHEPLLERAPHPTLAALEAGLDAREGSLNRLGLLATGVPALSLEADALARHTGIAWGLARTSGSIAAWSDRQTCLLPLDLLAQAGLGADDVIGAPERSAGQLKSVLRQLADAAHDHLKQARRLTREVPADALAAIAHAALTRGYARQALAGRSHAPPLLMRQFGLLGAVLLRTV